MVARWPWLVIVGWVVIGVALSTTAPSLGEMSVRNPIALLPSDAPSTVAARQMTEAFKDAGSDNLLVVLLTNDKGLGKADEQVYRTLVDRLRRDPADVVMVQDLTSTPLLRDTLASRDGKAWILPVGLAGELGTPKANDAFLRVSDLVRETVNGSGLNASLTGPAATVADLTAAGADDRMPIELAIGVLLLVILTVIYRKPATMVLPLLTIGAALVSSQGIISVVSLNTGLPISNQSIVLLSAMIAGAGTDYAVFLISRYHDYIRRGVASDAAVQQAMVSIGRVIAASAATVGITFLGMGFAKLGVFATTGVVLAIAIAVAFAAAVTLLPAVMVLVGRRGWITPRAERAARFWGAMGVRIVRRPVRYLVASLVVLVALAACSSLIRYNYDDRKVLPAAMPSSLGYAELDRHFSANQTIPQYLLIESPKDLRNPRALADLDQMAQRVSQVPDVFAVRGVTRPGGDTLPQARATFQAGQVGEQLGSAAEQIVGKTSDLDRLSSGAEQLAASLGDVRGQVAQAVGNAGGLIDALGYLQAVGGGDKTFADIDRAARLVTAINALGATLDAYFSRLTVNFDWLDPVVVALDTSQFCDGSQICVAARGEFHRLLDARNSGALEKISALGRQMQLTQGLSKVSSTVEGLSNSLKTIVTALNSIGMTDPATARMQLTNLQSGTGELASASRQIADGVELLVAETKKMGKGLDQASSFLVQMGENASTPAMSGFNIPPGVLNSDQFRTATKAFVSPDGHAVRYLIQTSLNPFSPEAMDQVNSILEAAKGAQPNTTLADATVSLSGYPVTLRDTRDYYDRDLRLIIGVTIVVVLLILMLLLRAVVAPFYLVGSVILSFLSAVGLGVLVLQYGLHQQLHWSVAGLAFVVLVAVGADYNMLLASRMRDESAGGLRSGIIRTVRSTGGVITAAGLIFSASMFGLLFSSIATVAQAGFIIGMGILLDTFVVRTITVPAAATLLGRSGWWPSRPWLRGNTERSGEKGQLSPAE